MCRNLHILKQNFLKFEKNRAEEKIGLPIPKIRYPRVISTALAAVMIFGAGVGVGKPRQQGQGLDLQQAPHAGSSLRP